jgi:hypothetical protein
MAASTIKSRKRRRVARIAVKVAVVILLVYFFLGGEGQSPFFHFLEWVGIYHVDRGPDYDGQAKAMLLRDTWEQDAYFERHEMYEGPYSDEWPLPARGEVVCLPVSADKNHYETVAFHLKGKKAFSVRGPLPKGDETRKKNMKEMPRGKAISLAVERFIELLKRDYDGDPYYYGRYVDMRRKAAWTLGELGDSSGVEPLAEALKDEDVRFEAAIGLSRLKDVRAIEPLIEALKDENRIIRRRAVIALGYLNDARAVEPLIEVIEELDDWYIETQLEIGKVLNSITGENFGRDVQAWRNWWKQQQGIRLQGEKNGQD